MPAGAEVEKDRIFGGSVLRDACFRQPPSTACAFSQPSDPQPQQNVAVVPKYRITIYILPQAEKDVALRNETNKSFVMNGQPICRARCLTSCDKRTAQSSCSAWPDRTNENELESFGSHLRKCDFLQNEADKSFVMC